MGRVFMNAIDDPFRVAEREIERVRSDGAIAIFVDFHAEATSEKMAFAYHLDGRVTAVIGTHTHVQTADERILPGGTAALTDVGMTGPHDGVIGMDKDGVIARFLSGLPARFDSATGDPRLHGVCIDVDAGTGKAVAIERIAMSENQLQQITDTVTASARA
jgi:2',3'-cyclic-nucleotide 2'-phosphodiesterase